MSGRERTWPLIALGAVLALVPLALLTFFSISLASDEVRNEVRTRVTATASLSGEVVREEMTGLASLVESYAGRRFLIESLGEGASRRDARSDIRTQLTALKRSRSGIYTAFIARPDGRLIEIVPATPSIIGRDFSFRDWYRGVRATGQPYVSEAYRTQARGNPIVVAAAAPVHELDEQGRRGRLLAILVAAYDLEHLNRLSEGLARAQGVLLKITDQRGNAVAQPGRPITRLVSRRADPRVRAAMAGRSGITELDTAEGRRLSAYAPVPEIGWTVTASVPANTAFAAVRELRATVLTIASLLAVVLLAGLALLLRALRARQRAEQAARHQAGINEAVLEATTDGIALVDSSGCLALANSRFEQIVSDMIGEPANLVANGRRMTDVAALIRDQTTDPAAYAAAFERIAADGNYSGADEYTISESGRSFMRFTAPVASPSGERIGRLLVLRETTQEREADRLKTDLIATVSHELRTPLTGILGFAELVRKHDLPEETQHRYLETIYNEARRLTALINDFLDLQRIEAGAFTLALEPVDISSILRQQAELGASHTDKHRIEVELPDEAVIVAGDQERLTQVVTNLVSNAIKYSPAGGEVRVAAEAENGAVRVSIADSGVGIPADQQAEIFKKFFRVDSSDTRTIGGTGLGLALCREIVQAHGGEIGFDSIEGEGSTFWFTLPSAQRRHASGPARVLVVEDDAAAAEFLAGSLTAEGFAVEIVVNGEEAVERAVADPPAAICLDIALPGELDGWEVLTRLKENEATADVPVVICTARNGRDRATLLGAADFLTKPIDTERLLDAVRRASPEVGGSVLVVEDDPNIRRVVADTLAAGGFTVREAADGQEALDEVALIRPDAIVLDLVMPRVDGFGVIERLHAEPPTRSIPIVVLTASQLSPDERKALRDRAISLLEKSLYSADELRRVVGAKLGGPV